MKYEQQMDSVWGFGWDGVESMQMDEPEVGRYLFQVTSAKRDVNKKGNPYVNVGAKVLRVINGDTTNKGKVKWEYLSLEPARMGFTKAFFENIGAAHILVPNRGPADAVGVTFEADVVETKAADGTVYKNLRNLKAVGSQEVEEPDEPEGDGDTDEDTGISKADIMDLSLKGLKELVEENDLDIDLDDYKGLTNKKAAVIDLVFGAADEEGSDEESENTAPRKGSVGKRR